LTAYRNQSEASLPVRAGNSLEKRIAMPNLLLIPTTIERRIVEPYLNTRAPNQLANRSWQIELCGFGLVAAAACTVHNISLHRPERIILVGIAGSLQDSISLGAAQRFDRVTCHGIGVGESLGVLHRSADEMGWSHCEAHEGRSAIGDSLSIAASSSESSGTRGGRLLSVTTASANKAEANIRRQRYPDAIAEDMEGFSVAFACAIADIPVQIVRGISNRAGERDHAAWKIEDALQSAVDLAIELMSEKW